MGRGHSEPICTMNSLAILIAPLALLYPASLADAPSLSQPDRQDAMHLTEVDGEGAVPVVHNPATGAPWDSFTDMLSPADQSQVRIEQRVILRITPRPESSQRQLLAQLPRGAGSDRLEERKIGSCVSAQGIAGVQAGEDNQLILFMRDRRIIAATLEKACTPQNFYSGFYLERSNDGQLCVKRDKLHSRAGAKCEIHRIRQLVAVRD